MNHLVAKLILQAYRAQGADAADLRMQAALALMERDPELKKWFSNEQAWDQNVVVRLEDALPVPRKLRANLLALQKWEQPLPWWRNLLKWSVVSAATALVLLTGFLSMRSHPNMPAAFRQAMVLCALQDHDHVTYERNDLAQIRHWLEAQGGITQFDLPPAIKATSAQGGKVIAWHDQKVTMICFFCREKGEHLDLFILHHQPDGSPLSTDQAPRYASQNGLTTAAWSRNGNYYLLTGASPQAIHDAIQSI
ncbi:MAG TPA: hypothetical protein VF607_01450 [Verrucomicrobiae bacterium]